MSQRRPTARSVPRAPRLPERRCRDQSSAASVADEEGFILVAVLVLIGLLGLMAFIFSRSAALDIRLAEHAVRRAEAESIADGLVRLSLRHLAVNPPAEGRSRLLRLDGTPAACRQGASTATLTLTDADGLVNLNLASQELIERLVSGIMESKQDAAQLAQAIVDFRSPGPTSVSGGDKRTQYELAGLRHGPKNAPFETVSELDQVAGMTADVERRLRPLVTVHSRTAVVNLKVASAGVVMALAGEARSAPLIDFSAADQLRATLNLPASFTFVPRTRTTQTTASKSIVVRVDVRGGDGGYFARQVVAELGAGPQSTPALKDWTEVAGERMPAPADPGSLPACVGGLLSLTQE